MDTKEIILLSFFALFWLVILFRMHSGDILSTLGNVIAGIVYNVIKLILHVLSFVLASSFVKRHSTGVSRVAIFLAAMIGLYLLMTLSRSFIPAFTDPYYDRLFVGSFHLALLTLAMLVLMFVPLATANVNGSEIHDKDSIYRTMIAFTIFGALLGGLAVVGQNTPAPEMASSDCEVNEGSNSPGVLAQTTNRAIGLFNRLRNNETPPEDPCDFGVK